MKIGTILKNTSVNEDHPLYLSIYTGQSNGKTSFIYPYLDGINNGHYLNSDIGKDKTIQPVGYINLAAILEKEIKSNLKKGE